MGISSGNLTNFFSLETAFGNISTICLGGTDAGDLTFSILTTGLTIFSNDCDGGGGGPSIIVTVSSLFNLIDDLWSIGRRASSRMVRMSMGSGSSGACV